MRLPLAFLLFSLFLSGCTTVNERVESTRVEKDKAKVVKETKTPGTEESRIEVLDLRKSLVVADAENVEETNTQETISPEKSIVRINLYSVTPGTIERVQKSPIDKVIYKYCTPKLYHDENCNFDSSGFWSVQAAGLLTLGLGYIAIIGDEPVKAKDPRYVFSGKFQFDKTTEPYEVKSKIPAGYIRTKIQILASRESQVLETNDDRTNSPWTASDIEHFSKVYTNKSNVSYARALAEGFDFDLPFKDGSVSLDLTSWVEFAGFVQGELKVFFDYAGITKEYTHAFSTSEKSVAHQQIQQHLEARQKILEKEKQEADAKYLASAEYPFDRACLAHNAIATGQGEITHQRQVASIGGYENKGILYNASELILQCQKSLQHFSKLYFSRSGKKLDTKTCKAPEVPAFSKIQCYFEEK